MKNHLSDENHDLLQQRDISLCQGYFTDFLPEFKNRSLIEGVEYLNCSFAYRLPDNPTLYWYLEIVSGKLTHFGQGSVETLCCFVCDMITFLDIVGARISPQDAFFDLRVDIEGDIELGLELSAVLETFFMRYPYLP